MEDRHNRSVSLDNLGYWQTTTALISYQVLLPIFVIVGLLANILSFCFWMFGPKSKSMCCAIYFAANSAVDFLLLTEPPLWNNDGFRESDWLLDIPQTDVTCKLFCSLYLSCIHLSTCISAIITVERSLTILFPLQFKCQDMRRRSKYVILVIVVLQPFIQFIQLYYIKKGKRVCEFPEEWPRILYYRIFSNFVVFLIPLIVIVVFNVATVAALFKQRLRRNTVSGSRNHVIVFTKLTIMTGVSFVLSYTYYSVITVYTLFENENIYSDFIFHSTPIGHIMIYFNCLMNPVICFILCKSTREDIVPFLGFVAQKIQRKCICTCKSSLQEVPITSMNNGTSALDNEELAARNTGTRLKPNIGTTSASRF